MELVCRFVVHWCGSENGEGVRLWSDEHPVTINDVKTLIPMTGHRHCAWHIVGNLKDAWETTINELDIHMKNMKKQDEKCYKWRKL